MSIYEKLLTADEPLAAGLFEDTSRGLFYRKALALRRFYETAPLYDYNGGRLYPSGKPYNKTAVRPYYLNGFSMANDKINAAVAGAADAIKTDFLAYAPCVPYPHTVAGNMYTHSMPHYKRIASEGLDSYVRRIEKITDYDMRDGLIHLIEGLRCYQKRILEYLRSVNAYPKLIEALEQVPFKPARDIYEALVCHNFVFYLDTCDNEGCLASDLLPYYKGENIVDLLREFYRNVDDCDSYSMSLGVDYNPLTVQCLEAVKGMRRPMIELFIDDNCPDEVWNTALDAVRTNGGQPAFYNHALIDALGKRFPEIRPEDLERFCGGGCTEAMLEGISSVGSLDAGIHLLYVLRNVLTSELSSCESFEAFYARFIEAVKETVEDVTNAVRISQKRRSELNPVPMRTLLVDDCIDNGRDFYNDGARYSWSVISFAGITNVIDSLLTIEDYIYTNHRMTAGELIEKLEFSDKEFLSSLRNSRICHGIDNAHANEIAARVTNDIFSMLDGKKPYYGLGFVPASIIFQRAAADGKYIKATPDGRFDGDPIGESLGAIFAKDTEGATALLSSVASMALDKAPGTPVVNLTVNPDFSNEIIRGLIKSYFDMGGMHLQITCTSKEMLEEAYADPDKHRNLVIRVGGYSEYFCRLDDDLKRLVMSRMIH